MSTISAGEPAIDLRRRHRPLRIEVEPDRQAHRRRVAAGLGAQLAHPRPAGVDVVERLEGGVEGVAEAGDAAERGLAVAADPDRHRPVRPASARSRPRARRRTRRRSSGSASAKSVRNSSSCSSARLPRWSYGMPRTSNSSRIQPTPTPRIDAALRQVVERGDRLGRQHRRAVAEDQHRRAELAGVSVQPATKNSVPIGSSHGMSTGGANDPSSVYGYFDSIVARPGDVVAHPPGVEAELPRRAGRSRSAPGASPGGRGAGGGCPNPCRPSLPVATAVLSFEIGPIGPIRKDRTVSACRGAGGDRAAVPRRTT